jgi:hypothetical protein
MADPTEADKAKAQRIVVEWHGNSHPPYPHRHLERRIAQALADEREAERQRCERALASMAIDERLLARLLEQLRCLGCEGEHGAHYAECPATGVSLNEAARVRVNAIRSRGPAPERPQHTTKCGELWCIGEECPAFGTPLPGARPKPAPVDPVREAAKALVVRRPLPIHTGYDAHTFELWQALALALEKTEASGG